jgi:hypothetical protein
MNPKLINKTEKQAKIEKAVKFLNSFAIDFISKNNNVHIYFYIDELRFDFWPSTDLLWISEKDKTKRIYRTVKEIYTIIEKELFNIH